MRTVRVSFLSIVALAAAVPAFTVDERLDRLPERHKKWLEEEVVYIISDVERETFLGLESEEERHAFIDAFWLRRDTNPNTPENEYQQEHYRRIAYANEFLGRDSFLPGWKTDRGKYYILLGAPATREDFTYSDRVYPAELWFYQNPELTRMGLPAFFYLLFFKRGETGPFQLYDHVEDGPAALLTGYQTFVAGDFRENTYRAYDRLYEVSPELAHASLSFRTDEGNNAADVSPLGTIALLEDIDEAPLVGVDTSYAERFALDKGMVESDYLFNYVPSSGAVNVLPGPGGYYLHWVIELDPQHVAVVHDVDNGRYGSIFDVSLEVVPKGDPDLVVVERRSESFLGIDESQARSGLGLPYLFSGATPLVAGSYDVRIILRNKACPGRYQDEDCRKAYTLHQAAVDVPAVQFERPGLTELVLAHRLDRTSGEPVYRSYRFGNLVLYPNPLKTYAVGETVIVLCEPLNAPTDSTVRFRIHRVQEPRAAASDDASVRVEKSVAAARPRTEPLTQELGLEGLQGGRYELSVELVGAGDDVLASRRADFQISPRSSIPRPAIHGRIAETAPEIPGMVDMVLGEEYLRLKQPGEARGLLEKAVAANPRLVPALELYAPFLLEEGKAPRVIELLGTVYDRVKDRFEIARLLGLAHHRQGNFEQAIEALERAATLRRPTPGLLNTLAESHVRAGHPERARELYQRSLEQNPNQPAIEERLERLKGRPQR